MSGTPQRLTFARMGPLRHGPLFSAELAPGAHAIVIPEATLAESFLLCASGMLAPQSGRVHFGGVSPHRSPQLRARLPTLLPREIPLPLPARSWGKWARPGREDLRLGSVLGAVLELRNRSTGQARLRPQDLSLIDELLELEAPALTPAQLRRVSLALALSLPSPAALLLYEPLQELSAVEATQVLDQLTKRAQEGAIVVFVMTQKSLAEHLAPHVLSMQTTPAQRYRIAARYAVHTNQPEALVDRLAREDLSASLDPHLRDRVHVSDPDEEKLLEALTPAFSAQSDEFGVRREALSAVEIYEDPDPAASRLEP